MNLSDWITLVGPQGGYFQYRHPVNGRRLFIACEEQLGEWIAWAVRHEDEEARHEHRIPGTASEHVRVKRLAVGWAERLT